MKRSTKLHAYALSVSISSLYRKAAAENAARLFDALYFWFFSFIFTRLPIRKKRLA